MTNMAHCRFENTLKDLKDCYNNFDENISEHEEKARLKMIKLCCFIALKYGDECDMKIKIP